MRFRHVLLSLGLLTCAAAPAGAQAVFTDVTADAGIDYLQHAPQASPSCLLFFGTFCEPERQSGGAAVADVDLDGDLDLFVTLLDASDMLFINQGDGTFVDGTAAAGLTAVNCQANGASFGDIDNDGDPDLFAVTIGTDGDPVNGRNYLYINDGSGVFTEEAVQRGAAATTNITRTMYSAAMGDYDNDGYLDVHTTEWLSVGPSHSRLLRNQGAANPGHFVDRTLAAQVPLDGIRAFSSAFLDIDEDGHQDLLVAADFGTSKLFWNDGDGTFTDGTAAAGVGTDQNGMGSTVGDYDGDGDLDWFVSSICRAPECYGRSGNRLYRNDGNRVFSDATDVAGVRNGYWGWGSAFFDYDNDGDLDLALTNGVDYPDTDIDNGYQDDPMRFWENVGRGRMTERSAAVGLTDTASGKGMLVFDYDADGDLDLFVVNNAGQPRLYRNDGGNANDWLRVVAQGTGSNRDGIGAKVVVRPTLAGAAQTFVIGQTSHYLTRSENVAHFGLGAAGGAVERVLVGFPGGQVQGYANVARNTTLTAVEAACTDADGDGYCVSADCNDASPAVHFGAAEICDGLDNDCDGSADEDAVCATSSGGLPADASGDGGPLRLGKLFGGELLLQWGDSCATGDSDFAVYAGALGGPWDEHNPVVCGTGGSPSANFAPQPGDRYYLVVPRNGVSEGSYGRDSAGVERSTSRTGCVTQSLDVCW